MRKEIRTVEKIIALYRTLPLAERTYLADKLTEIDEEKKEAEGIG